MRILTSFLLGIIWLLFTCCSRPTERDKYVIGLSQCMLGDAWRQAMIKDALIEASNHDHVELIVRDARNDNERQIEHIRELIRQKVDVLIISPYQSGPITEVAEDAYRAGIPTIITDRKIDSDLYTTFVGANNYDIGWAAGQYAAHHLPPNALILEIWGLTQTSPAQERHKGFKEALTGRNDIRFRSIEGQWLIDTARIELQKLEEPEEIDFVFAHNDMMAIAARDFFLSIDSIRGRELHIIGVDAVPGAGLEAVADGRIDASFMYPTGGEQVIRTAMQLIEGKAVERFIPLRTTQVDRASAQNMLLQVELLNNYEQRIQNQRARIDGLQDRFLFLRNSLGVISWLMLGVMLLAGYAFHMNRKMRRANQKLIDLNAEIKEVTAQRLRLFTNVSHEVRTPLTLILAPLERLIESAQASPLLPDLQIIQKNANRLLRVINQLLDFRKIENQQEHLQARELELTSFIAEIKGYFDSMAELRAIEYQFHHPEDPIKAWIDPDLMEKSLVNLLSNAFKFTPEKGSIHLELSDTPQYVLIQVSNSGKGIAPERLPRIFDRFYSEDRASGTGIGLYLVQSYARMHKGEIFVESEPNRRTTFTIQLLKGEEHLTETDKWDHTTEQLSYEASCWDEKLDRERLNDSYPYTILLVEDDDEVRNFLSRELSRNFMVKTAIHGREALQLLETEPISLVVSDVMMPEMNGFELCQTIKGQLPYSHLPVVLLTALTDERQRIHGIAKGADAYIQKPFHLDYLKIKMIQILQERERLRMQFQRMWRENEPLLPAPVATEGLDDSFLRKLMECIEAVYADPDYNVERLSDSLHLSRGHLYRKIKELTGSTPVEFLRNYRLNKAVQLLRQKKYTVSEVAYQTGFSSPAYFSKCFKALYQTTPTEFK